MTSKRKCILRIQKIKSKAQLVRSTNHNLRESPTPNTDKEKQKLNLHSFENILFKNGESPTSSKVIDFFSDRLSKIKVRKNAVQCVEFFIGCSQNSFENKNQYNKYLSASKQWLDKKFGKNNVILASIHHDETTPHLAAYVLPIVMKKGKETLNARHYFGSTVKLSELQTEFYEQVGKDFGLERGVKKSKLQHITAKEFATAISKPIEKLPSAFEFLKIKDLRENWKTLHLQLTDAHMKIENLEQERNAHNRINERLEKIAKEKTLLFEQSEKERNYAVERKDEVEKNSLKEFAKVVKKSFTPQELEKTFNVKLKGKEDIFDALMKSKKACDFETAVKYVMDFLPSKFKDLWETFERPLELGSDDEAVANNNVKKASKRFIY